MTHVAVARIGIDIGRVLVEGQKADDDTGIENKMAQALPYAIESVTELVQITNGRVWLISKAFENMQKKTWSWLLSNEFFQKTGVLKQRLLFCRERSWKATIAEDLGLTHFVDDKIGCLAPMRDRVRHLFWFNGDGDGQPDITPVKGWEMALPAIKHTLEEA